MIVKKTKQLGNFKKGINLYVPRRRISAAPTTIALGTPLLYLSGLTFPSVDGQWSYPSIQNPYYWEVAVNGWLSQYGNGSILWDSYATWFIEVQGFYETGDENGGYTSRTAARITAPSSALPLYGWTNESWVTGGTIVISTTP